MGTGRTLGVLVACCLLVACSGDQEPPGRVEVASPGAQSASTPEGGGEDEPSAASEAPSRPTGTFAYADQVFPFEVRVCGEDEDDPEVT